MIYYSRRAGKCKVGARTSTCCAHVATGIYAAGLLAHNPGAFKSSWREYNYVDAGKSQALNADILAGLFS